ncbi:MAG: serine hydrolase, partial [Sedimenticola sp.]
MKKALLFLLLLLPAVTLAASQTVSAVGTSASDTEWERLNPKRLKLRSKSALVIDGSGQTVYAKDIDQPRPIASITKLMTAMVIIDSGLSLEEKIRIGKADRDLLKLTGSRLKYGATLSRGELLRVALLASDNRAASALGRTFPGGHEGIIEAMNHKAAVLGMSTSRFTDPTGLDAGNIASARDLAKMVRAAMAYPLIRQATTLKSVEVYPYKGRGKLRFGNTNRLLKNRKWKI